ncbi:unnamed protein product [Oppiella nova]|uniref:NADP-dependent oxidoreductase domain-containing protein n=1 Tax=Oppiella nova TaxID=334625 RepID=A0A7R9QCU6_9ACAR|nr:unnamed protein product [Oppiella nova]CAG2162710.1 unnamed protein product [Oppiella nova]
MNTRNNYTLDNKDTLNDFSYMTIGGCNSPAFSATPSSPHYEIFANFAPSSFIAMKYRNLGKNGLRVPNVGFSAWNAFGNRINEQMAEELLTLAYENGVNYFDTGDGYANGKCETASLKRLQLKYIDILIINKLDGLCPMEELVSPPSKVLSICC